MERHVHIPRVVIAGTQSGVGKTTLVAGLLGALKAKGVKVQSFKVGPDYIDPGFHKLASGRDSYNLDTWLVGPEKLAPFFAHQMEGADFAVIEGVMGLYDGGKTGISSTAEIAKMLKAPVILVIDTRSMGESAAALALGFKTYDPEVDFRGVLLNRLGSENHERMIVEALERLNIPVIGCIHRDDRMQSPERHLGLTPVTEIDPTEALCVIQGVVEESVDLEAFEAVGTSAPALDFEEDVVQAQEKIARIGVAYDEAFSFYYPASLAALEKEGADIVYFSPLRDQELPEVDALLFGGGFPEMFLSELEGNSSMKSAIRQAAQEGMPIYAECGGLMYLCESITDFDGNVHETVGVVPAVTVMQQKLQRVGYVTATAQRDTILGVLGEELRGHEFHFSTMEPTVEEFPWAFSFLGGRMPKAHLGGYAKDNILASYLHLNFAGSEGAAEYFVQHAATYRKQKEA